MRTAARSAAFVLTLLAVQPTAHSRATAFATAGLTHAWTIEGAGRGVAGDPKSGLIYVGSTYPHMHILVIDLNGTIQRRVAISGTPMDSRILRLARFGGDHPALLASGNWSRHVRALDHNGNLLWTYPDPNLPVIGIDDVNVVDLNGDGVDEVIIGFNGKGGLRALDSRGQLVWQSREIGHVWHVAGGDVLGNGRAQVVSTSGSGLVHVFSHDGMKLRDLRPGFDAHMVRVGRFPKAAGADRIFATAGHTTVAAFSGDGVQHWARSLPGFVWTAWLAPQEPWLAVSVTDGDVYVLDAESGETIGSVRPDARIVEVGWSAPDANGKPLLLVSGGRSLNAYRVAPDR